MLYREILEVIAREYPRPDLHVEDVARAIASSPRQVQRVLIEVGNVTFTQVLLRARMLTAARMLLNEPTPVREIASRVGYRQASQFSKTFRRHFGASPREYRVARDGRPCAVTHAASTSPPASV